MPAQYVGHYMKNACPLYIVKSEFLCYNEGWEIFPTPIFDKTESFQCLRHSNWTICNLLSQFCSGIFPCVSPLYWGAHFILPQRAYFRGWENSPTAKFGKTEGFQCLGHSNWTICSLLSPFCSGIFHLHTGGPFLITPEGLF